MTCRICAGALEYRFSLDVLQGRHRAEYHECRACHSLQVPDPHWLDEAYRDPSAAIRADGGRFRRTFSAFLYLTALTRAGALPSDGKLLDFAGGYGLLAQMLANAGLDAWTSDPYERHRLFAVDRWIDDPETQPPHSFQLITALEVFEHLTEPIETASRLHRLLSNDGSLILSTGIYDPKKHGADWPYLAPETGQHITFFSRPALRLLAGRLGFRSLGFFPGDQGILILFSPMDRSALHAALLRAYERLDDPQTVREATRSWDLRTYGWIPALTDPVVDSVPS